MNKLNRITSPFKKAMPITEDLFPVEKPAFFFRYPNSIHSLTDEEMHD